MFKVELKLQRGPHVKVETESGFFSNDLGRPPTSQVVRHDITSTIASAFNSAYFVTRSRVGQIFVNFGSNARNRIPL